MRTVVATTYPNIALVGPMASGKTTIATYLRQHHGYVEHHWTTGLHRFLSLAYGPIVKTAEYILPGPYGSYVITGRQLLQRAGTDVVRDQLDTDFWVKAGIREMSDYGIDKPRVNDDTRFHNEELALRERGWIIVGCMLPEEERLKRVIHAYGEDLMAIHHASEDRKDMTVDFNIWTNQPAELTVPALLEQLANR